MSRAKQASRRAVGNKGTALPPDPSQPVLRAGLPLDNPNRAGNCATCHTPVASKVPNQQELRLVGLPYRPDHRTVHEA